MSKYIKVEDIKNTLIELVRSGVWLERKTTMSIINALANLPTLEVDEGEWVFEEYPDGYYHSECSICKHWFIEDAFLKPYKFCPNCGAKMGGDE